VYAERLQVLRNLFRTKRLSIHRGQDKNELSRWFYKFNKEIEISCQQRGHLIMTHDVFISYSTRDKVIADALCATLESRKIRCWIAPRDVIPGTDYAASLIENLNGSRLMVLVFSQESNNSSHVMREVERAVSKGIPIIPLRIENVTPTKAMEYYLSAPHWLDALTPPLEKHLQRLADTVQTLLQSSTEKPLTPKEPKPEPTSPVETTKGKPKKKKRTYLIAATIALIAIIALAAIFLPGALFTSLSSKPATSPTPTPLGTSTPTVSTTTPTITPTPTSSNSMSSSETITLANVAQVKQIGQLDSGWVHQIAWSPDGKFFAVAAVHIDIYNAQTKQKIYTIEKVVWPNSIAFSPDSHLLVAGGNSGGLNAWNVDGWGEALSIPNAGNIACLAFSSDGKTVAAGIGAAVRLIDITNGNELHTMPAGFDVFAVTFSPDGKTLASGGGSGGSDIKLWDTQNGQELKTLTGHTGFIESLAYSSNGQTLASASTDRRIMLWNPTSGQQLRVITGHTNVVRSVTFSPDGQLIASASWDLTVRIWDANSGEQLNSLTGHTFWIYTVAFSTDGDTLASGAEDQAIRLWGLS
jgi:WD40 repeat protein